MNRGDVYAAATGSGFGDKPRPVVLVNAQRYLELSIKLVASLSRELAHLPDLRPIIEPDALNNLRLSSAVMVDVLIAVPERKFGGRIGELTPADLARVDLALVAVMGLPG